MKLQKNNIGGIICLEFLRRSSENTFNPKIKIEFQEGGGRSRGPTKSFLENGKGLKIILRTLCRGYSENEEALSPPEENGLFL